MTTYTRKIFWRIILDILHQNIIYSNLSNLKNETKLLGLLPYGGDMKKCEVGNA